MTMTSLIFGKYEIIRRLAIGGMGEIFLARQRGVAGFDRLVILKSLLPDLAESASAVDMFLDEARVAATLNHPNVVSIYEVGQWDNVYFIGMEYIEGENVGKFMRLILEKKERMPPPVCARIIHDAAVALDYAHRANDVEGRPLMIVHRDVSPENIMVRIDGVTKVVDFGIAKAANRSTRTKTGVLKGKLRYMAPEQARGLELDGRSDQFSLGVVMWEMLAMKRMFGKSTNEANTLRQVLSEPIVRASTFMPDVPKVLDDIAERMLQREPDGRYPTLREVAQSLRAYLEATANDYTDQDFKTFVGGLIGARVKDKTTDLTPSRDNFLITLTRSPERTPEVTRDQLIEDSTDVRTKTPLLTPPSASQAEELRSPVRDARGVVPWLIAGTLVVIAGTATTVRYMIAPRAVLSSSIDVREPKGSQIFIDGVAYPVIAPAVIEGLVPGAHEVRLELSGHEPIVKKVDLDSGAVAVLREYAATIQPIVSLTSDPPGATVRSGSMVLGMTPLEIKTLVQGTKHELHIEKSDFVPQTVAIELAPGEKKQLSVTLLKVPIAPIAPIARVVNPAPARPTHRPSPSPAAVVETNGYLSVNTKPWTKISIGAEPFGTTPLFRQPLSIGAHQVHLTNEQAKIDVVRSVTIKPGETSKLDLDLNP